MENKNADAKNMSLWFSKWWSKMKLDVGIRKMIYSSNPTAALLSAVLAAILTIDRLQYYLTIVTIESIESISIFH